ncbi:hypothetical protein B0H10DRAFT_2160664 [Mycena sp. CBHHK59/15]|nr:hypothetical protein B0H10DRAFT_2160664 [Mycena sp. CBHHK59/15]
MYEGRFQAVIRNIRVSGAQPSLDDYNFILEQFAAVGHHFGAMQVYRELTYLGILPRTKTFGLCLQAIAHRIAVTRRMVSDLVNAMKSFNIPFTSVNLDLTLRVLKETTDLEGLEILMKWGYGIDLANPDCPPLEYLAPTSGADAQSVVSMPRPQSFSTAALNTTIDTLGRLREISRMVQAFEVLTTPLPQRSQSSTSSYDEDEDDDYGVLAEPSSTFTPPYASPNTTTYNILLRHVSQAGHAVFARHYLLQAIELDRQEVPAPHFAINRGTLLSVFGESNRDKNVGLMRWLHLKFPRILSKKRGELKFFTRHRDSLQRRRMWPYEDPSTYNITPAPSPIKTFNLDLHIRVLKRDISEIEALYAHVQTVLARTTLRVKERLGRHDGESVWRDGSRLQDSGNRPNLDKEEWRDVFALLSRGATTQSNWHLDGVFNLIISTLRNPPR